MLFSGTTLLSKLLQIRPGAVEILESTEPNFWSRLDMPVEDFCQSAGLNAASFLKKVGALAVPRGDSDWIHAPLYRLLDFLTDDHRRFLEKDLAEISHLLDLHNIPVYPDGYVLKFAFQSYQAFEQKFREHMREEEEHVFPHILHLEASQRHPELNPQLHRGAVGVFAAMHNHSAEEELKRRVTEIRERVKEHRLQEPTATVTEQIYRKLEELEAHLAVHAALETEILFPRAMEIEKQLMIRELERQREALPYSAPA